jgi:hypothetical protein
MSLLRSDVLILVLWLHFITDFVLQNDKMAINKSSSNGWLFIHSVIYSSPFFLFDVKFALSNFLLHFMVDFYSSRLTTKLYLKNKRHWFFVAIGFDQVVHISCLILTMVYFNVGVVNV